MNGMRSYTIRASDRRRADRQEFVGPSLLRRGRTTTTERPTCERLISHHLQNCPARSRLSLYSNSLRDGGYERRKRSGINRRWKIAISFRTFEAFAQSLLARCPKCD